MKQVSIPNTVSQLMMMPVVLPETCETVGRISDVTIHPTEGRVLGLILQSSEGMTYAIAADDFFIFNQNKTVVVLESALTDEPDVWERMASGISVCRKAIGASIVTENGEFIGYVSDVIIGEEPLRVVYQVFESYWQKYFGRGFYIPADLPFAWSPDGSRFIVSETELARHRVSQPADAIRSDTYAGTI
jgi:sporulation protein YlmC with PRC-barrel domain